MEKPRSMWVRSRTRSPSRGSGSTSPFGNLQESAAISPSTTRLFTSSAVTVDWRKSPWIHPGGTVDRAPDGFFTLAPPFLARSSFSVLLFVIAAAVVEAESSGARGAGEAEEK
jgi:hypothetical protein